MRRCAVLQGIDQEAEFGIGLFIGDTQRLEDACLYFRIMNTDGATTDFGAVPDQIIGL